MRLKTANNLGFTLLELSTAIFILMVGLASLSVVLRHCRQLAARNGVEATAMVVLGNVVERIDAEPARTRTAAEEILRQEVARCASGDLRATTPVCRETNGCMVVEIRGRSGRTLSAVTFRP